MQYKTVATYKFKDQACKIPDTPSTSITARHTSCLQAVMQTHLILRVKKQELLDIYGFFQTEFETNLAGGEFYSLKISRASNTKARI
jgi:hypothetical protein